MEDTLFDLVQRAKDGDNEALLIIITTFTPAIRSAKYKLKQNDRRDDLEQNIIEMLIKKVLDYNLDFAQDFSTFCKLKYNVDINDFNSWHD